MTTDALQAPNQGVNWRRTGFLLLGVIFFAAIYYSPVWPDAVDPEGKSFALSIQGKGAIAIFLLAATWWIAEVVPIGVTSLAIGCPTGAVLHPAGQQSPDRFHGPQCPFYLWLFDDRSSFHQNRSDPQDRIQNAGHRG